MSIILLYLNFLSTYHSYLFFRYFFYIFLLCLFIILHFLHSLYPPLCPFYIQLLSSFWTLPLPFFFCISYLHVSQYLPCIHKDTQRCNEITTWQTPYTWRLLRDLLTTSSPINESNLRLHFQSCLRSTRACLVHPIHPPPYSWTSFSHSLHEPELMKSIPITTRFSNCFQ